VAAQYPDFDRGTLAWHREGSPPSHRTAGEEELARLLKQRSMAAWETLFERHFDRIYRYALGRLSSRESAEDTAAATFDRALATIDSYSYRGRPILAWLYGIAANVVRETLRGESRHHGSLLRGSLDGTVAHQPDHRLYGPDVDTAALASRIDLDHAIRRLTNDQREVVLLRYFAGLSALETGQVMRRPETAIYALQARALAALRRQLT
jgi:RNA polymerase sigma-70 factor, ECF subfamily